MTHLADALADCLEAFLKAEAELAACIQRYPKAEDELAALLKVVASLPRLPEEIEPSPAWRRQTKIALLANIEGKELQTAERRIMPTGGAYVLPRSL